MTIPSFTQLTAGNPEQRRWPTLRWALPLVIALQTAATWACADDEGKRERPPPKPMSGTGMMRNLGPGTTGPSVGIGTPPAGTTSTGSNRGGRGTAAGTGTGVESGATTAASMDAGTAATQALTDAATP